MTKENLEAKEQKEEHSQPGIQFHVPPELEYVYRDVCLGSFAWLDSALERDVG